MYKTLYYYWSRALNLMLYTLALLVSSLLSFSFVLPYVDPCGPYSLKLCTNNVILLAQHFMMIERLTSELWQDEWHGYCSNLVLSACYTQFYSSLRQSPPVSYVYHLLCLLFFKFSNCFI